MSLFLKVKTWYTIWRMQTQKELQILKYFFLMFSWFLTSRQAILKSWQPCNQCVSYTFCHCRQHAFLISGVWEFLFSADFLIFENLFCQNVSFFSFIFSLFLPFLPNFTPLECVLVPNSQKLNTCNTLYNITMWRNSCCKS